MSEVTVIVASVSTTTVVNGQLGQVEKYFATNEDVHAPIDGKLYDTAEEAQAVADASQGLAEGMAYATAQYPDLSDKARRGKANVIADYRAWIGNGRAVKAAADLPDTFTSSTD